MKLFPLAGLAGALLMSVAPAAVMAATPADTLVVAQNIDDIVSIDPGEAYEFSSGEYVTQTYDRLVQYDADDTKSSPAASPPRGWRTTRPRPSPSPCATG